jgi:hypothetical protein
MLCLQPRKHFAKTALTTIAQVEFKGPEAIKSLPSSDGAAHEQGCAV